MAAARRRRLRRATTATLLALLVLPPAAATPSSPRTVAADSRLTVTEISPVVEADGSAIVRGRLANTGSGTLSEPTVELVARSASTKRADIDDWADGDTPVDGESADTVSLDDIGSGDSRTFTLRVDEEDLAPGASAGAARVSIQSGDSAVRTFIGVHRTKEYVPMEVVWGVPLLLPADRRLFAEPGKGRAQAWEDAVGPDSRLAGLTEEEPAQDEAWLIDPTLLSLPPEAPEGASEGVASAMADERDVRSQRAAALRERLVGRRTFVLPEADADVAAGAASPAVGGLIEPRLRGGRTRAGRVDARANVMWPADGLVTDRRARALDDLHPGGEQPTLLTTSSALAPSGFTPTGAARTTGGTPLLVSDQTLSDLVGELSSTSEVALARQRLVAETSAVLGERPGTSRSLLVVPDRTTVPSPEAYAALRAATEDIPWLAKGDAADLVARAKEAPADQVPRSASQIARSPSADTRRPPTLTPGRAREIARDERSVSTFASVRSDGAAWRRTVDPSLDQLTSARWRTTPYSYVQLHQDLSASVTLSRKDLVVSSGDVNFFADSGRLQITIVNNSDVELSNLSVDLTSDNPSFRIDGPPDPVTIGPGGTQTVTVQATALAAGQAPVHVVVSTPDGQELTHAATLRVRMAPTGSAVYWVIGGIAVLLLGAGTWRTVRRPHQQTATEDDEDTA